MFRGRGAMSLAQTKRAGCRDSPPFGNLAKAKITSRSQRCWQRSQRCQQRSLHFQQRSWRCRQRFPRRRSKRSRFRWPASHRKRRGPSGWPKRKQQRSSSLCTAPIALCRVWHVTNVTLRERPALTCAMHKSMLFCAGETMESRDGALSTIKVHLMPMDSCALATRFNVTAQAATFCRNCAGSTLSSVSSGV